MRATTLSLQPARLDLELYGGDDMVLRLFFAIDAPTNATFVGTYATTTTYTQHQMVEDTLTFYVALRTSLNITPGSDTSVWRAISANDLSGYTEFASQIIETGSSAPPTDLVVDRTNQARSIIALSLASASVNALVNKILEWDIQAKDPDGNLRTFFRGSVFVEPDVTT